MKKTFIILGLLAITFMGTSFASVGVCDLSEADIATIEEISVLFDTHAEEKIINKHFKTNEYKKLARLMTEEGVSQMRTLRADCLEGTYQVEGVSMNDMEEGLQEYIYTLLKLKAFEKNHVANDVMSEQSVVLQNHLMAGLGLLENDSLSEYRFDVSMGIEATSSTTVSLDATIEGEGFGNTAGTETQGVFFVGVDGSVIDPIEGTMDIDGSAKVDVRMSRGKAYIKVSGFDLDTGGSVIDEDALREINAMKTKISLLENTWIELPIENTSYSYNTALALYGSTSFFTELGGLGLDSPFMMTYYEEGGVYYGGPSPILCGVVMAEDIAGCLEEIESMMLESQGKGFIAMQELKGGYVMSITDKYLQEGSFDDEFAFMNNQPFLRWNDEKITRMAIEVPEYGEARYDNGDVHVDFSFDIPDYDWDTGEIVNEEGSIKADGRITPEYVQLDMDISSPEFSMTLSLESFQKVIGPRAVELPDESDVVQLESLLF